MTRPIASVDVPASSANLGSGFDCMAAALSLRLRADLYQGDEPGIVVVGRGEATASGDRGEGLILRAFREGLRAAHGSTAGSGAWRIETSSLIPPARGLGSSAALIVAGLMLGSGVGRSPVGVAEILSLAAEIEGHADNVSAALHGGFTLTVLHGGRVTLRRYEPPADWIPVVWISESSSATAEMRAALPATIPHPDAVQASARTAALAAALTTGDGELLVAAMDDRLHQPYRLPLLEGSAERIARASEAGARGAALSGAGPSILAICDSPAAAHAVEEALGEGEPRGMVARLRFDPLGARLTAAVVP